MWRANVLVAVLLSLRVTGSRLSSRQSYCKCYPNESCWPSTSDWQQLNSTVGGNLLVALPPGAPCYNTMEGIATFNSAQCNTARSNYNSQNWVADHPIGNMWTFWTNDTCVPTTNPSSTCTRGYYGNYVILAKTREHIQAGVNFARERNLRLVIRNTGHDFMGRSTGYGSLIINTHSFKTATFTTSYTGPGSYRGGAVTVGAGIQVGELYRLANQRSPPVVVIGGECQTVGLAGGWTAGGGHGPMASFYGMGADQPLSFDVVTASGDFITANEASNPDLFWALKGGGPSTFAVVVSLTIKTHPEVPTAGIVLDLDFTNQDAFWRGVAAVHDLSNYWVENGMFVYFELGSNRFHVAPIVGPNMTAARITEVARPMYDALSRAGVTYRQTTTGFNTFYEMYTRLFEPEGAGSGGLTGGRVFTKQDISSNAAGIIQAYRTVVNAGSFVIGHIVGPAFRVPVADNAMHPAWRNASSFSLTTVNIAGNAPMTQKRTAQNTLTNTIGAALRNASPNGAAYVNEGDLEEPNWQQAYWGSNYPRLYQLKQVWDPLGVFYARTTPGTEDWDILDNGTRLCRRSAPPPVSSTSRPPTTGVGPTTTVRPTSPPPVSSTSSPPPASTSSGPLVPRWGQCGGIGWTGGTQCVAGTTCTRVNDWYYQCL